VLASGDNNHQPDALTGAGLAGAYNCPLLLVPTNYVDTDLKAAISAMPRGVRVHIVGGTPAVSSKVKSQIAAISTVASVDRYSGTDRYATANAVAVKMKSLLGAHFPTIALITNGASNAALFDPLIASTASANKHFPVLLVKSNQVPSSVRTTLSTLKLSTRYIVGNTTMVEESVRTSLSIPAANRIAGADVYGDAAAFADKAQTLGWLEKKYVGFAASVPDAATGGGFMGKKGGPLLLVYPGSVPPVTSDWLVANKATVLGTYVFGGPPAVSDSVLTTIRELVN
jgi:putative cell wall-binding protein